MQRPLLHVPAGEASLPKSTVCSFNVCEGLLTTSLNQYAATLRHSDFYQYLSVLCSNTVFNLILFYEN